ncbi:MAG: cysteine--tRNA ligase, partial [Moraxellaceae bacterium]
FFTIRDVMQKFTPEVIRYFIIASHYRSPINFSDVALKESRQALSRFYLALKEVDHNVVAQQVMAQVELEQIQAHPLTERFNQAMSDDFNTPEALAVLFELVREINRALKHEQTRADAILLEQHKEAGLLAAVLKHLAGILGLLQQQPEVFLKSSADDESKDGLNEDDVLAAIEARKQAKANKDFAQADQIRNDLLQKGIVLEDSKAGTTWRRVD